jgi:HAD superfamily hydrolase (TIGR01484 family)
MKCPKAAIFDLDDTLAESFQPPTPEMLERIEGVMALMPLAIVSAAGFPRMRRDFLSILEQSPHVGRLYILPNSSGQAYAWRDGWNEEYSLALSPEEREKIKAAIEKGAAETGVVDPKSAYAPKIIDRDVQVAYAALGLDAPLEVKKAWDPDQIKRRALKAVLDKQLPECEVLIGGQTTIDITRKGINKAYGVKWLSEHLKIPTTEMLYVGDALYEGGNDAVVIPTGIQTHAVCDPAETLTVIDDLLRVCAA